MRKPARTGVVGSEGVTALGVLAAVGSSSSSGAVPGGWALLPVEFLLSAVGFALVSATSAVPVIAVGAVVAGLGTGMLLPTLLTWAVNRLDFQQRGRGTGLWTGTLFVGEFLCPLLIAAIGASAGGLRPAIGVLAILAVLMAVVSALVTRRNSVPLDVTTD